MVNGEFWLTEAQFARLAPLLPNDTRGVARVDDRRVISGIVHVLQAGCRWRDAPEVYGPRKTLYNRFVQWARKGVWLEVFTALAQAGGPPGAILFDSTHVKAHRSAAGGKGGPTPRRSAAPAAGASKIHLAVDQLGRPRRLVVRPGHRGDAPMAAELLGQWAPRECLERNPITPAHIRLR